MTIFALCIAAATVGIDVGWQRMPQGGMEYIIQLDRQTLEALRAGEPVQSDIPPGIGEIRSYRIVVGDTKLPRESSPELPATPGGATAGLSSSVGQPRKALLDKPAVAPAAKPLAATEPAKPWLPLTLTLLGFFASLGANVYLGWIAWQWRPKHG
jgi:hypothetical protein